MTLRNYIFSNLYYFIILVSIVSLSIVYVVEYIFGFFVCVFCVYQRFFYLIFIYISLLGILVKEKKEYYFALVGTTISSIILSAYHSGIERELWEMSSACFPKLFSAEATLSLEDFQNFLYQQKLSMCNKPALMIFGLSIAEWNLSLNIVIFIYLLGYYIFKRKKIGSFL